MPSSSENKSPNHEPKTVLDSFMDAATDGFAIFDNELRLIRANENWLKRANVTEKAYGTHLLDIFPVLNDTGRYEAYQKVIKTGETIEFENIKAPSGTSYVYDIRAFKVGEGLGIISRNITRRVKAEENIIFINELLKAIRNVNQLMVVEKDQKRLVSESCRMLASTKIFQTVYIALADGNRIIYKTGFGEESLLEELNSILAKGQIPEEYMEWATKESRVQAYKESTSSETHLLISPLNYHNLNYGVIICQTPANMYDQQIWTLFVEIIGDISYALYALSMAEKFNSLFDVTLNLSKTITIEEVYDTIFKAMTKSFQYRRCSILLVDEETVQDVYLEGFGENKKYVLPLMGPGLVTRTARTGKTVYVPDISNDSEYIESVSGININSELCVPVTVNEKVVAILNVERQERDGFTLEDINLLETLAQFTETAYLRVQSREKIQSSEKNLRDLLNNLPDPVVVNDSENYLFVNKSLVELLGYTTQSELVGKQITTIIPENSRSIIYENAKKRIRGESIPDRYEIKLLSKSLEEIDIEVHLTTILFENRPAILGVFRDIRERKQMDTHINYLYNVLLAIRNVNQLIVTEKDRNTLLLQACKLMVETKGYHHARIMYEDRNQNYLVYDTSVNKDKPGVYDKSQIYPCTKIQDKDVFIIKNPSEFCKKCPLYMGSKGYSVLLSRLSHNDKNYGYFTSAVPVNMIGPEEIALYEEVSGDISYALHALDLDEEKAKAVNELRTSEERYKSLLESGMDGVTVNILGKLVYVNPRFVDMIGYSEEELIGSSILDLHAPEYRALVEKYTRERSNGSDVPNQYDVELIRKDGTRFPVSHNVSGIEFEGKFASLTFIRDISERKKMESAIIESEHRLRSIIDASPDLIIEHDIEGNILFNNEAAADFLGFSRESGTRMKIIDVIPKKYLESLNKRSQLRLKGDSRVLHYELEVKNAEGNLVPVLISSAPIIHSDTPITLLLMIRDISAYKEAQKEQERINQQLVEERLKAEQIKEMDRLKTEFMNSATHEIRTPITSIRGYSELIGMALQDGDISTARDYFETVIRNVDRLELLSNDLLDLQRLESGRIHLNAEECKSFDLVTVLQKELQPILSNTKHTLTVETSNELAYICDKSRLLQVLINLLNNSCKYSPPGSEIKLTIQKEDDFIRFSVTDQGIGIRDEDKTKLFKPFPEIYLPDVNHGSGLGLSICKGIVELHGGKIWVESGGAGKGASFVFTIPQTVDTTLET